MSKEQKINVKIKQKCSCSCWKAQKVVFTIYLQVIYNTNVISTVRKTNVRVLHDFYKSYRPCTLGEATFLRNIYDWQVKRPVVCCLAPQYFNTFLKSYDQPWGPRLANLVACTIFYRRVLKKHIGNSAPYFNWYIQQWYWITELNQIINLVLSFEIAVNAIKSGSTLLSNKWIMKWQL